VRRQRVTSRERTPRVSTQPVDKVPSVLRLSRVNALIRLIIVYCRLAPTRRVRGQSRRVFPSLNLLSHLTRCRCHRENSGYCLRSTATWTQKRGSRDGYIAMCARCIMGGQWPRCMQPHKLIKHIWTVGPAAVTKAEVHVYRWSPTGANHIRWLWEFLSVTRPSHATDLCRVRAVNRPFRICRRDVRGDRSALMHQLWTILCMNEYSMWNKAKPLKKPTVSAWDISSITTKINVKG
jgi:hypothetical protein